MHLLREQNQQNAQKIHSSESRNVCERDTNNLPFSLPSILS